MSKIKLFNTLVFFKQNNDAFPRMRTDSAMSQMLGLADKYLQTVIIIMPNDVKENGLLMNEKIEILSRKIETIRIKWKIQNSKIKYLK